MNQRTTKDSIKIKTALSVTLQLNGRACWCTKAVIMRAFLPTWVSFYLCLLMPRLIVFHLLPATSSFWFDSLPCYDKKTPILLGRESWNNFQPSITTHKAHVWHDGGEGMTISPSNLHYRISDSPPNQSVNPPICQGPRNDNSHRVKTTSVSTIPSQLQ